MIQIKEIEDFDQKTEITLEIMNALPKWFSPPEDIVRKSMIHREFIFFAAFDEERVVGFIALKQQTAVSMDIYTLGVLEDHHRQGIGHLLVRRSEEYCREKGVLCLTVKTLDDSAVYEPYERTRAFYAKNGFLPLEVFPTLWDEHNPCLFLAKFLH